MSVFPGASIVSFMGVNMGFELRDRRLIFGFLSLSPSKFDGICLGLCFGRFPGALFAGFIQIYRLFHQHTVAQWGPAVYQNRMKITDYLKGHWQLIAIVALVFALWTTSLMLPLKILVVFLHEASHALAALFTGGSVEEMSLSVLEGGHVVSRGGNLFLIIWAGYLGSLGLGTLLFVIALQTRLDRPLVALLGAVMILFTFYMREFFPVIFCIVTGGVMLLMARYLDHRINDLVLRVIGLTSMIYVPYDIFSDTILRSHLTSDARLMAQNIGGPTLFWGVLWLIISLIWVAFVLRYTLKAPSNISFQWKRSD